MHLSYYPLFRNRSIEEIGFRVLLLPHPSEGVSVKTWYWWGCISLFLFVIYHPLNGLTIYKSAYATFSNPIFLILATLLGIACILAYRLTHSLWPSVIIHWLVVVIWLCCLGGSTRLLA
ncbi:MAG: CPBP family intramembrane metalloprotease [Leptolyngbya sp. SIO3F4]|nr:CPBP family intramembrane metalloprotease [Leptolyngbya sp. SIO3F4]